MRVYISADARCRQLERLVRKDPGLTIDELALIAGLRYSSAAAYVTRLERENRILGIVDAPATPRGCTKRLYPPGWASPAEQRRAA